MAAARLPAGTGDPLTADEAWQVVALALRAPSLHNTQPWRFVLRDGVLELHADRSRHLPATDPDGRQLVLSCGAALFGARLAVRALGRVPHVQLAADPVRPDLLARLTLGAAVPAETEEVALSAAVPRRHSQRHGLLDSGLPTGLLPGLRRAAATERAVLLVLDDAERRRAVADLVAAADRAQHSSPEARRELARWTGRPAVSAEGLPPGSWPQRPPRRGADELAVRDFAGRTAAPSTTVHGGAHRPRPAATGSPLAAAVVTRGDTVADWLHAGQALYRVLLTAAGVQVQASLHSQPFGLLGLRRLLQEELTGGAEPQMLLQLGRPVEIGSARPLTPRRPVEDVLVLS